MLWFLSALIQVGVYVGTAILSALLDRRSQPDTKPGEPQFPKADAQAPIPVIYGTTRVGMNVVHLAGRTLGENTLRNGATTLGWSSTHLGYYYYLDLLAVLGWGPLGALHDIIVDGTKFLSRLDYSQAADTIDILGLPTYATRQTLEIPGALPGLILPLYTYPIATSREIRINAGHLLGGKYDRGGIGAGSFDAASTGIMRLWPGTGAIEHNTRLETLKGGPLPTYPNLITVAFEDNFYFGNSEQLPGIEFIVSRAPSAPFLGTGYIGNNTANAGHGANPAGILWDLLTNGDYGLGISPTELDEASFRAVATALDKGLDISADFDVPLSLVLDGTTTGKAVLSDLIRTLDAVLALDPETGLLTGYLLRGPDAPHYGYAAGSVVVDESMIASLEWSDGLPDSQVNAIEVEFIDKDRDYTKNTVTARNVAAIQALGREEKRTVSFLGVQDADLAMRLAQRELRATTTSLGRASIVTNRKGFNLMPGRCFSLTYGPRGFVQKTMRVVSVRDQHLGGVTIEAIEDVYSSGPASFAVETTPEPTPPADETFVQPFVETDYFTSNLTTEWTLKVFDPQGRVTNVGYFVTGGTIDFSAWFPASTYKTIATPPGDYFIGAYRSFGAAVAYYRVSYTAADGSTQYIIGRFADSSPFYRTAAPVLRMSKSGGIVTVEAVSPDLTVPGMDLYMYSSTTGYRAWTSGDSPIAGPPYTISFPEPGAGEVVYVSAIILRLPAASSEDYSDYTYLLLSGETIGEGSVLGEVAGAVSEIGIPVAFWHGIEGGIVLTDIPAASTEVHTRYRRRRYMKGAGSVRLNGLVSLAGASGTIGVECSADNFATAGVAVASIPVTAAQLATSGWLSAPGAMKGDITFRLVYAGGAGTADAEIDYLEIEVLPALITGARDHSDDHSDDYS